MRIVNTMDAPEWIATLPAGETITRPDSLGQLEPLLAIPPEKRPTPKMHFIYIRETGWNVLAVYWVYRETEKQMIGSMIRDTWARTEQGWRRIRHEKLFPDRPLIDEGNPVVLPPPM